MISFMTVSDKWIVNNGLLMVDLLGKEQHSGQWGIMLDIHSKEQFVLNVSIVSYIITKLQYSCSLVYQWKKRKTSKQDQIHLIR